MLEATVTVDDHGAFKAPWSGMVRPCAENNQGYEEEFKLLEYPMPVANQADF